MRVLVATEPDDTHAIPVKLALEQLGHTCDFLFTADTPSKQKNSVYITNEIFHWTLVHKSSPYIHLMHEDFDVIWWRRPRKPHIPRSCHKNDVGCVTKENLLFHESIPFTLSKRAWWVNPIEANLRANAKMYQLQLAPNFNFKIPPTLISNCPKQIRSFIKSHPKTIYKSFHPHYWYEDNILKIAYTTSITAQDLKLEDSFSLTPGIYQKKIRKKYELRVTCFGDHLVAIKIQPNPDYLTDWRTTPAHILRLEPYVLPIEVQNNIRLYMKKLGIVFGCFDFIMTPDNELYFLEVNQQGQFLWIEDLLPEIKLLDMFVHFLIAKTRHFTWDKKMAHIAISDYESKTSELMAAQLSKHVFLNQIPTKRNPK